VEVGSWWYSPSSSCVIFFRYDTTLERFIRQRNNKRFPPEELEEYVLDVVRGIEFLHSQVGYT
jgi:hypothetical protein